MIKNCHFCQQKIRDIDYQNVELIRRFTSGQEKILPPKRTGLCSKHQRKLAKAIKKARIMGLMPFAKK